jgi:phage tail protein X
LITVEGDFVTVDLLVWRRYKTPALGVVERMLEDNPHLAKLHKLSPFLPVGTQVRIPIDLEILKGRPKPQKVITLYGRTDE